MPVAALFHYNRVLSDIVVCLLFPLKMKAYFGFRDVGIFAEFGDNIERVEVEYALKRNVIVIALVVLLAGFAIYQNARREE